MPLESLEVLIYLLFVIPTLLLSKYVFHVKFTDKKIALIFLVSWLISYSIVMGVGVVLPFFYFEVPWTWNDTEYVIFNFLGSTFAIMLFSLFGLGFWKSFRHKFNSKKVES